MAMQQVVPEQGSSPKRRSRTTPPAGAPPAGVVGPAPARSTGTKTAFPTVHARADNVRRVKSSSSVRADPSDCAFSDTDTSAGLRRLLTGLLVCLAVVAALALSAAPP